MGSKSGSWSRGTVGILGLVISLRSPFILPSSGYFSYCDTPKTPPEKSLSNRRLLESQYTRAGVHLSDRADRHGTLLLYVPNHGAKIARYAEGFAVLLEDVHQGEIS